MKIKELHINDFKFFGTVDPNSPLLNINGQNLLVYGENGSGKSSIYWSLYTLLESSFKSRDEEIKKYFVKSGNESLVNIYASGNSNSFIKIVLENGATRKNYKVSHKKEGLRIRQNPLVMESNMASDFLNYRVLFQLHNLKNSQENDLWKWFELEILPYVKKGLVPCLTELQLLEKGPRKIRDLSGEFVFPTANLRTSSNAAEKTNYLSYKKYKEEINNWMLWLNTFLNSVSSETNIFLTTHFRINLKIRLVAKFEFPKFEANSSHISWKNPSVQIIIDEFNGIPQPKIKKPHTFLNEAKWSAIGLSIRFSILKSKLYTAELKCLVIDDLLLSLDMTNRDIVLELILDDFSNDYQIFFLTHDRFLFEMMKYKIEMRSGSNWKYIEMYEDHSGAHSKPLIMDDLTQIKKTWSYFYRKEFASSANTLRKACEKLCKQYLSPQERININYTQKDLHQMIVALNSKGIANGVDPVKLGRIIEYKDRILNASSHYDITTPIFENELKKGIETIEAIAIDLGLTI